MAVERKGVFRGLGQARDIELNIADSSKEAVEQSTVIAANARGATKYVGEQKENGPAPGDPLIVPGSESLIRTGDQQINNLSFPIIITLKNKHLP